MKNIETNFPIKIMNINESIFNAISNFTSFLYSINIFIFSYKKASFLFIK